MRTIARQVVGSSGDEERDPASRATEENRGAAVLVTCRCPVVGTPVHSSGTRLTLTLGGGPRDPPKPDVYRHTDTDTGHAVSVVGPVLAAAPRHASSSAGRLEVK